MIAADAATWQPVADDVRGGMRAFQRGRLTDARQPPRRRRLPCRHQWLGRARPTAVRVAAHRSGRISTLVRRHRRTCCCASTDSAARRPRSCPRWPRWPTSYRWWRWTSPASASRTSRSALPTTPPGSPARCSTPSMRSASTAPTWPATAWAGGWPSRRGSTDGERVRSLTLLSPALAWLRDRRWAPWFARCGQSSGSSSPHRDRGRGPGAARRAGGGDGWSAAGVDEFLRAYLSPRGRAAFYAAARNIYLDEPHGDDGFWTRLSELAPKRCSSGAATTSSCRSAFAATWRRRCRRRGTSCCRAATCRSWSARARRTRRSATS